jgi:hypothetical protein
MILALAILATGLSVLGIILTARWWDMQAWRRSLVAFRLHPPASLAPGDVANWLAGIAATTHPSRFTLMPLPPVALETVATSRGIAHYVLVVESAQGQLLSGLRGALPGARIEEAPDYLAHSTNFQLAAELTMTTGARPLASARAEAASSALLAALQPVGGNDEVRVQWIFTSAGTPEPVHTASTKKEDRNWSSYLAEGTLPRDAEAVQAARLKLREPLLGAVARVGVVSQDTRTARALFHRVWNNLHILNAPGVRLRRRVLPSKTVARRMAGRTFPIIRWPLLVNVGEAAGLIGLPVSGIHLPGLSLGTARQLPPSPAMASRGVVLGVSNYPGMTNRTVALTADDRLRHMSVLGPTGSGKSWFLANLILQDIHADYGVVAVDPKGDLITDVLARIDARASERVIVLDASKREWPIGFNILGQAHSEEARDLIVDNVVHIFRDMWSAYWGPRSDHIMRGALATLVSSKAPDGSAFTMQEILPLLTNPAFRRQVTGTEQLPRSLRTFWQWYDSMSDGERTQAIGPVLNKVEAFLGRTPIRLMLGQSEGIDLSAVFRERKVLLVSLAKGTLGTETANLLGSLLVSAVWQATLARVTVPAVRRRPVFAYIDEAQDLVRMPLAIADMLAQARGLRLSLTLAHQYLAQLPEPVKAAVLGTVRTQVAFAVEHDDAGVLARRFGPLTQDDLKGLATYEIAVRPCVSGTTLAPVTVTTVPLPEVIRDADALARASRERFGVPRGDVEAAIETRAQVGSGEATLGRTRRGGRS